MKKKSSKLTLTVEEQIAIIEAVLFVSKDPINPQIFLDYLEIDIKEFETLVTSIEEKYKKSDSGILLKRSGGGIQLVTKPELHKHLTAFFTIERRSKLTVPSLETLSIIAYKQPVTLAEISRMRNINSIGPIKSLLQKKLIRISGRKHVPGLPALYSTTQEFLLYFGLNDLTELPSLEELTEMFEDKEQPSLFN
jgi:segregation and condensation protein B